MATISAALAIALQHQQAGRLDVAEDIYRRILAVEPNQPDAWHLLGVIAYQMGKHEVAVECIRRAVELNGTEAIFHNNLGKAYRVLRRTSEAVACYRRALELKPDYAEAHNNLGVASADERRLDEAVIYFRRALELKPDYAEAHNNLGAAFKNQGKLDEAVTYFRRALELERDYAEAHNNLGAAFYDQGRLDEAVACYRRALELGPDFAVAYSNLGAAFYDQGKLNEAVACYRRALELNPDYVKARSNLLDALQYRRGVTLAGLFEAHQEYERRHAAPLRSDRRVHANTRDPSRKLRLGFLSPDFHYHPVGFFLISVLESFDLGQCDTICYHDGIRHDDLTARCQAAASTWRDGYGLADAQLAEQIRADRIDILFDLAGHTANNRLLVFARKPAPIQITWIGYEGTTGLSAMDYIIADRHMIPEGSEPYYAEQILCMPEGYVCFDPPIGGPEVNVLPAATNGYVTYGSFSNLAKIGPQVVEVWAEILRRVPHSKLAIKHRGLGDEMVRRRYLDRFTDCGVEPHRLVLLPESSYWEYLASYHCVDIALDPFPFSGSATTCEALWMGIPVVTCPGETFASRHGLTHLSNVGLADEFAARDLSRYVELAVRWANDLDRLAEVRALLRARMANSPLCDSKRFAANLMTLLRDVWRKWVSRA